MDDYDPRERSEERKRRFEQCWNCAVGQGFCDVYKVYCRNRDALVDSDHCCGEFEEDTSDSVGLPIFGEWAASRGKEHLAEDLWKCLH